MAMNKYSYYKNSALTNMCSAIIVTSNITGVSLQMEVTLEL